MKALELNTKISELGLKNKQGKEIFKNFGFSHSKKLNQAGNSNDVVYEFVVYYDDVGLQFNQHENNLMVNEIDDTTNPNQSGGANQNQQSNYETIPVVIKEKLYFTVIYPYQIALPLRVDKRNFRNTIKGILSTLQKNICKKLNLPVDKDPTNERNKIMQISLIDESFTRVKACCICSKNKENAERCSRGPNCVLQCEDFSGIFGRFKNIKLEIQIMYEYNYVYPRRSLTFSKYDIDKEKVKKENEDKLDSLKNIIQNHIQDEIMNEENSWFCSKCNRERKAVKRQRFVHMPE